MIHTTAVLRDERLTVDIVRPPNGDPPIGVVSVGEGLTLQSSSPELLLALSAASAEAASRLSAARDVHVAQQLGATA